MMTQSKNQKTVCFTGHRSIGSDALTSLRSKLYSTVMTLVNEGYDTFICGGAMGFDTEAAECVINIRSRFTHIRLKLFLPCRDQTAKWKSTSMLSRYKTILGAADEVMYISDFYTDGCMLQRNRCMVDASDVCVAYMHSPSRGTGYTVRYAVKSGLRVINLADSE